MLDQIRKISELLSPRERKQGLLLIVLMIGGASLEMLGVGAIPAFVSLLANPAALQRVPGAAHVVEQLGLSTGEQVVLAGAASLFGLFVVKNVFQLGVAWVQARYVLSRQASIATRLLRNYLYSPYTFHLQRNTAELLRNLSQDAFDVIGVGLVPALGLVMEGLTIAGILMLLLLVDPVTSLAAFAMLGGTTALFLQLIRRRTLLYGQVMHESRLRMIQTVNEGLGAIKVTKVLGREDVFLHGFTRGVNDYVRAGRVRLLLGEVPRLLLETVGIAGLLALAGLLVVQGRSIEALIPTLALLAVALVRMIPSFNRITGALNGLRYGQCAVDSVHRDLRDDWSAARREKGQLPALREAIQLERVTVQYTGTVEPALRDISLTIRQGTAVAFVGRTGAGKTTLVDVILGLLPATTGRVTVDGVDIRGREQAWQRQIGYVPQDTFLTDDSIRRNIAFGLPDAEIDEAAVWRAVDAAQVREFVECLPGGLDTVVGERGVRLSGGQRQRIGIARALYHDPKVLVLDEATSALDHETERAVMNAVEHLRGSRTILMIAHRLTTIEACDCVVTLHEGRTAQRTRSSHAAFGDIAETHAPTLPAVTLGASP